MDAHAEALLARQRDAIRQGMQRIRALSARLAQPIAIVGMACRLPGADSPDALWTLLRDGREAVTDVPVERWRLDDHYAAAPGTPYKTYARRAGYLADVACFDARFFGISPREAQCVDPQQRLLLEVSHHAIEDAELPATSLRDQAVGVFVGISSGEYAVLTFGEERADSQDAYSITGTSMNAAAGRLAYHYGLLGPALAIDTACSSSLVAIHQACRSLINDECHTALAAGVNCLLTPQPSIALAQNKVLSASGHCSPFAAEADGLVRGEGCGVLVLRRLDDALAQGNRILAVIRGGHVNQDGASSGLTVPNGRAQQALIDGALRRAKLAPEAIAYVEAHGTGTALGDPIELQALQSALGVARDPRAPLLVGALKAHIGHLEAASGVAGVIKVVLAMRHRMLPAQINFAAPSPRIDWRAGGVSVVTQATPLEFGAKAPFHAGVSSFGFSGTNAHLILQDPESAVARHSVRAPTTLRPSVDRPARAGVLVLSAKAPHALRELVARCIAHFRSSPDWAADCDALNAGRAHYAYRAAFVAKDARALVAALQRHAESSALDVCEGACDGNATQVWLFTGQGSQYASMGRALYETVPAFRACLDAADRAIAPHLGESILPVIWGETGDLDDTRYTQPAIFALQYALSHHLHGMGLRPRYVLGHSIGEYAAAVLAGVFSLDDGARMIVARGRLMALRCAPGGMLVLLTEAARADALADAVGDVALAVANGPANRVYAGSRDAIERLARAAQQAAVRAIPLAVSHGFHSPMMEPMLGEFGGIVRATRFAKPQLAFISSALGRLAQQEPAEPAYWIAHVRAAVRYDRAVAALCAEQAWCEASPRLAIEIGPAEQLIGMARPMAGAAPAQWLGLLRPADDLCAYAGALRALFLAGLPLRWPPVRARDHRWSSLPRYPFQRQRYWLPMRDGQGARGGQCDVHDAHIDYEIAWREASPDPDRAGAAPAAGAATACTGRWLLLVGEPGVAAALGARLRSEGAAATVIQDPTPGMLAARATHLAADLADVSVVLYWPAEPVPGCAPGPDSLLALLAIVAATQALASSRRPEVVCVGGVANGGYRPLAASLAALARSLHHEVPDLALSMIGIDDALRHDADAPARTQAETETEARADGQADHCASGRTVCLPAPGADGTVSRVAVCVAALLAELRVDRGADRERWLTPQGVRVPRLVARAGPAVPTSLSGPVPRPRSVVVRGDRSYLVTGGTGALGASIARALLEGGARDVVLASRRGSAAEPAALRELADARGARLTTLRADLADADSVASLFERISQRHAPLAGIVHAAGQLADAGWARLDAAAFERVFGAKVRGAWLLDRLSRNLDLDAFVMLSSISALLGAPGQAHYAAANAALEGLARQRRADGLPGTSVCLGAVAGDGMASGAAARRQLQRAGIRLIESQQFLARCLTWFAADDALVVVAAFAWTTVTANSGAVSRPLLRECVARHARSATAADAHCVLPERGAEVRAELRAELSADVRARPPAEIETILRASIARVLGMPDPQAIDATDTLHALGIDSITLVELRDELTRRLGRDLPTRLLYDYPQVERLARQLSAGAAASRTSPAPAAPVRCPSSARPDIAVVGIACRLPGGIASPEAFWAALLEGRDLIGELDAQRWDAAALMRAGALATVRAGIIDGIDRFDCELFGISPREAQCMDPQQRLLLETGWEALERAGYDFTAGKRSGGTMGGVFIGPGPNDYARRFASSTDALSHHHGTGNATSVTAGRLAFVLDWQGPALAVDTACSSSLMAVHLAVQALRRGECDIALAGGVNLLLAAETSVLLTKGAMLAPDGRCKAFDAAANGYVRSEGCALVVLKRLDDARAAGDTLLAIVRGSASNHDGHSQGLTAPNGQAQQRVLRAALADAALDPAQVDMLEAHGTGTPLGDPIEFAAARAVYADAPGRRAPLAIGSVKTNLGHAEAAAGIVGFIKAVLCLHHETIVPHLHFDRPHPELDFTGASIHIPTTVSAWRGAARCAAISAFGFSGTNVHVLLSAVPARETETSGAGPCPPLSADTMPPLRISAASPAALRKYAAAWRALLAAAPPHRYGALVARAARRAQLACTHCLEAADAVAAIAALDRVLGASPDGGHAAASPAARDADAADVQATTAGATTAGAGDAQATTINATTGKAGEAPVPIAAVRSVSLATPTARACAEVVDAPLYPFDRQRFWLAPRSDEAHEAHDGQPAALGVRLTARDSAQVSYAIDYATRPPFRLDEHLLHGERVVPAAAHLASILAMLSDLRGERAWQIVDVVCEEALIVGADRAAVRYVFDAQASEPMSFMVAVLSDGAEGTRRHLRAAARALPADETLADVALPSTQAIARFDAATFYDQLYDTDVRLAGAFRSVRAIEQHLGHAVAEVAWPCGAGQALSAGVLDSLLQTISLATMAAQAGRSHMRGATIPLAIERLVVCPRAPASHGTEGATTVQVSTRLVDERADGSAFVHELSVAEAGRSPFIRVEGLLTRRIEAARLRHAPSPYLLEQWVERPLAGLSITGPAPVFVLLGSAPCGVDPAWFGVSGAMLDASALDDAAVVAALAGRPARFILQMPDCPSIDDDGGADFPAQGWLAPLGELVAAVRRAYRIADALDAVSAPVAGFGLISNGHAAAPGAGGSPAYGYAVGLLRSLRLERPDWPVTLIDLDADPRDRAAIAAEWHAPQGDCVSYRDGRRYVRRVSEQPMQPGVFTVRGAGFYLLTGGLGALATQTCGWLAEQGARHVVLAGRRESDAEVVHRVDALRRRTGLRVDYHACDVADHAALNALVARAAQREPLRGIFHCAGVLADGSFATLDDHAFARVVQGKVLGAWNLHRLSAGLALDCFVLYSSLASLLGAAGQSNYAAANGFMDQLAHWRRACGLPALSLNWAAWDGAGMASGRSPRDAASHDGGQAHDAGDPCRPSGGLRRLPPARALRALQHALAAGVAQVGVAEVDWTRFATEWRGAAPAPALVADWLAGHPVTPHARPSPCVGSAPIGRGQAGRDLAQASGHARLDIACTHIGRIVHRILARDATRPLPKDSSFHELGFDSLMAIELKRELQAAFGRPVPATVMFDHPDIESLARWIASPAAARDALVAESAPVVAARGSGSVAAAPARVDGLDGLDALDEAALAVVLDKLL